MVFSADFQSLYLRAKPRFILFIGGIYDGYFVEIVAGFIEFIYIWSIQLFLIYL